MKSKTQNPEKSFFTDHQKAVLAAGLEGAPESELERFFMICERTLLDPFVKQLYARVQRRKKKDGEKWIYVPEIIVITSIDGFRAIAERSGEYRGQTKPEWFYRNEEGVSGWFDVFIPRRDQKGRVISLPEACRVGIIRHGFPEPVYGYANFESFATYEKDDQQQWVLGTFWNRMPEHMIAKVAEAQGHRKTFPLLTAGLFLEEEIKEENGETPTPAKPTPEPESNVSHVKPMTKAESKAFREQVEAQKQKPDDDQPPGLENPASLLIQALTELSQPSEPPKQEPAKPASGWEDYVISQISLPQYKGRKLSDLTLDELTAIKEGWVDRYGEKIAKNPAKQIEAAFIVEAIAALS